MSWNGSHDSAANAKEASANEKAAQARRQKGVLIGGALLALLSLVVILTVFLNKGGNGRESTEQPSPNKPIASVSPQSVPKDRPRPKETTATNTWNKPYPPKAYRPDGTLKKYSRYVRVETNDVSKSMRSREQEIFPEGGPNLRIASLLAHDGGDTVVGDWNISKRFNERFRESLKTPIVINEDDDDYAKELKKAVIATKEDMRKRLDAGEDLRQLLNDARQEMRELYLYREEIKSMVSKARKESKGEMTSQDLKDLYTAANQMLKDRGVEKEIAMPEMIYRRMTVKEAKQKAKSTK